MHISFTLQIYTCVCVHTSIIHGFTAQVRCCANSDLCSVRFTHLSVCEKRTMSLFCASCHVNACRVCPLVHRDAPMTDAPNVLHIAKPMQINNYPNLIFCRAVLVFGECRDEVVSMIYAYPSATVPIGFPPKLVVVDTMRQGELYQQRPRIHF